jgi:hypothetical protein
MPYNVVLLCTQWTVECVDEERNELRHIFENSGCDVTIMIGIDVPEFTRKLKSFDKHIDFLVYMGHQLRDKLHALDDLAQAIMLSGTKCLVISSCDGAHFKRCLQMQQFQGFIVFFEGSIYGDLAMELDLAFCRRVVSDVDEYNNKDYKGAYDFVSLTYANMTDTRDLAEQISDGDIGFCCVDENWNHQRIYLPNVPRECRMLCDT